MRDRRAAGAWLMAAAAFVGLILGAIAYFHRGSGVDHTAGALLVVVSTALLTAAGVLLGAAPGAPGWLRGLLLVLCLLDVIGTGVAAGFLHAWTLVAAMVVALAGWLVAVTAPAGRPAARAA